MTLHSPEQFSSLVVCRGLFKYAYFLPTNIVTVFIGWKDDSARKQRLLIIGLGLKFQGVGWPPPFVATKPWANPPTTKMGS